MCSCVGARMATWTRPCTRVQGYMGTVKANPCTDTVPAHSAGSLSQAGWDSDNTTAEGDMTQLSTSEPLLPSLPKSSPPEIASWQAHPS